MFNQNTTNIYILNVGAIVIAILSLFIFGLISKENLMNMKELAFGTRIMVGGYYLLLSVIYCFAVYKLEIEVA